MNFFPCFICLSYLLFYVNCLPDSVTIGGLFDSDDDSLELAFRYAVKKVNKLRLLPKCRLYAQVERIVADDTHTATQKVCSMLQTGVAAIFGPQSQMSTSIVQSICDTFDIPHIGTGWNYRIRRNDHSLNVFPYPGQLSEVIAEIVKSFHWWSSFAILYENNDSLARLQDVFKLAQPTMQITSWQLNETNDHRSILRNVKTSGQKHAVIDCSIKVLPTVLREIQQVGMMTDKYEYFITNLDLQTIDLDDFQYSETNITGIRLLSPSSDIGVIVSEWNFGELQQYGRVVSNITEKTLKTDAALMYDAVIRFAMALRALDSSDKVKIRTLSCDSNVAWNHGISLINFMKGKPRETVVTLTGLLELDVEGFWRDFHVDVIMLKEGGFKKIGYWSKTLNMSWPIEHETSGQDVIVYNVSTIFGEPYFSNKTDAEVLVGNQRYQGYVVDLLEEIAKVANFSYRFIPAPDNQNGAYNETTGEWSGMIGEIMKKNAQMAVADLTITSDREKVVSFSTPFMNLGISLLFKAKTKEPPALFSFLSPFSPEVWLYMAVLFTGVSLILFILARFSPYEWDNPYPCIQDPDTLENNFTVVNSMWFTIGTLMQQGSDVAPRAPSVRIIASLWSFFTLIIISSYTANLATFLVIQPRVSPIEYVEDLPMQTKIKYGCGKGGSTEKFFKNAMTDVYKKINNYMEKNPSVILTGGNTRGVEAVKTQDFAFFMESTTVDYTTSTNCGLRKVTTKLGGNLDNKGYGIAVTKNDPLRFRLTDAILKLQEDEVLQTLWKRWWEEKSTVQCDDADTSATSSAKPLTLENVGGVFVVVASGMGVAFLMALFEFVWTVRKNVKEGRGTFCSEFWNDLKFVIQCHGSTKPIRKASSQLDNNLIGEFMEPYRGFEN